VQITELPIGTWTEDYKQFLESLLGDTKKITAKQKISIKDYNDMSTESDIDIVITFYSGVLKALVTEVVDCSYNTINDCNALEKYLKLYSLHSTTNMHLFDANEKLKKYDTVNEIIEEFYVTRLEYYDIRRTYIIENLERELVYISNKARFISDNLEGKIDLRRMKNGAIVEMLSAMKYDMNNSDKYAYLIGMPMSSVSEENVNKLMKEKAEKERELVNIKSMTIQNMWVNELE